MLNCLGCLLSRRKTTQKEDAGRKEVGTKKPEQAVGKKTSRPSTSSTTQTATSDGVIDNNNNHQQQDKQDAQLPRTAKEELVAEFFGSFKDPSREITRYCTDDCDLLFVEANMTITDFLDETLKMYHSFPDFHYHIETITERPDDNGTVVVVRGYATGTHTGAPFGFGPYPEIAAKGTRVVLDPEYVLPCFSSSRNSVSNYT
jgi:predicted ester cyclase